MLRHMQWFEAADLIVKGMEGRDCREDRDL